jgi:RNA polymerase sigma-70 factor (ECF subfamily)
MTAWASDVRLPVRGGVPHAGTAGASASVRQEVLPVPDAVLVARVLGGDDRHAFAELVRRHQSTVRALLRRLAKGNHALADDLAQDTFLQVHRNLRQYRGDARFATWIYRIAYNCFLAHARGDHPHAALPGELAADAEARGADDAVLKVDLDRALARLSDGERAAIVHCYFHDLSHQEAAWVLGCPVGTVKTNVLRGKQKLRALLSAWAPPGTKENER